MKLAVLYAGQGAQHPGMGKEFYEASSAFRAAFDAADLPFDLHRVCFDDPDGVLNQTEYTQPCICLLYTSPSPRDISGSRMPSSA